MKKILFVCLGNICRSSTAEGVMLHLIEEAGLEKELVIESNRTQPGTLYINKVLLNGKKFNQYRITHDELVHSQRILFDLK